jgi:hypothetical protein
VVLPGFFGSLTNLVTLDTPASSAITRRTLGWKPTQPGVLKDLEAKARVSTFLENLGLRPFDVGGLHMAQTLEATRGRVHEVQRASGWVIGSNHRPTLQLKVAGSRP